MQRNSCDLSDNLGLVNSVLNLPGGRVNIFWGRRGRGGGGEETGERMEKGPPFHLVIRAMRKSSRLHGKGSLINGHLD